MMRYYSFPDSPVVDLLRFTFTMTFGIFVILLFFSTGDCAGVGVDSLFYLFCRVPVVVDWRRHCWFRYHCSIILKFVLHYDDYIVYSRFYVTTMWPFVVRWCCCCCSILLRCTGGAVWSGVVFCVLIWYLFFIGILTTFWCYVGLTYYGDAWSVFRYCYRWSLGDGAYYFLDVPRLPDPVVFGVWSVDICAVFWRVVHLHLLVDLLFTITVFDPHYLGGWLPICGGILRWLRNLLVWRPFVGAFDYIGDDYLRLVIVVGDHCLLFCSTFLYGEYHLYRFVDTLVDWRWMWFDFVLFICCWLLHYWWYWWLRCYRSYWLLFCYCWCCWLHCYSYRWLLWVGPVLIVVECDFIDVIRYIVDDWYVIDSLILMIDYICLYSIITIDCSSWWLRLLLIVDTILRLLRLYSDPSFPVRLRCVVVYTLLHDYHCDLFNGILGIGDYSGDDDWLLVLYLFDHFHCVVHCCYFDGSICCCPYAIVLIHLVVVPGVILRKVFIDTILILLITFIELNIHYCIPCYCCYLLFHCYYIWPMILLDYSLFLLCTEPFLLHCIVV